MGKQLLFRTSRRDLVLGEGTLVMGILNATPDSFSDGGRFVAAQEAVEEGLRMVAEGADLLDVGGESTRPGADPVSVAEELQRVIPIIEALAAKVTIPISIDTTKAAVAREAIAAGAEIINDVSAMRLDPAMPEVAAASRAGLILMHMRGLPKTMQQGPLVYPSLIDDVIDFLKERLQCAETAGVERDRTMLDPGIGFGKTGVDNMRLLRHLDRFAVLGRPILTGVSRKSFIGGVLGGAPQQRLEGTAAAMVISIMNGSSIVRVHDVGIMKKVAAMTDAILRA